jgi:NADH-quinone oxidoreductase subunit C
VVYHFYSLQQRHGIVLKVETDREQPRVASVAGVWQAATWLEREIYDLFGVTFTEHPDLRRILLPDDWVGHPLRKDYQEAGGYHGIENLRPNPLVQLAKVTEEKRKAVAAAAAAAAAAAPKPESAPPAGTSGPTPPPPAPLAPSTTTATDSAPASASAPSPSPEEK